MTIITISLPSITIYDFIFLYRPLLKDVKKGGEIHIVLDCSTDKIQPFLQQAMQVGMMTAYHNYLITSLVRLPFNDEYT